MTLSSRPAGTRPRARAFFILALLAASVTMGLAAKAAVTPKPVPIVEQNEVGIAEFSQLVAGTPRLVLVPALKDLETKARRARNWTFGRSPVPSALPVYLVRDGDAVRGFIAYDPRNGCDLKLVPDSMYGSIFYDVCHGSVYSLAGAHVGGPSPLTLDELVLTIKGDNVFASTKSVIPGHWVMR